MSQIKNGTPLPVAEQTDILHWCDLMVWDSNVEFEKQMKELDEGGTF